VGVVVGVGGRCDARRRGRGRRRRRPTY